MEWFWGFVIIFISCCVLLLIKYCRNQCKETSASRPDEDYRISLPARPPGFREHNERVRLQREQPVLMPMPGRGYGNMPTFNTTVNPNCPYPPVRPLHPTPAIASAPYPPPLRNQVSSAEDLPPSYNEVVSNLNNRPNMRRSNSEGNVYN